MVHYPTEKHHRHQGMVFKIMYIRSSQPIVKMVTIKQFPVQPERQYLYIFKFGFGNFQDWLRKIELIGINGQYLKM